MFATRLGSLNALEQSSRCRFWNKFLKGPMPSADTLGRVADGLEAEECRDLLCHFYGQLRSNKAFDDRLGGMIALVVDGHEQCASYRRVCPGCLVREIKVGETTKVQYYHRYVAASLVSRNLHLFIDLEPILPGEDEVAAALRLIERVHASLPRAYDVVLADSLYARADFFKAVLSKPNKHVLTVFKQEGRHLMQDALAVFEQLEPETVYAEPFRQGIAWSAEDFTSWESLERPIRVVKFEETRQVRRQLTKQYVEEKTEWTWVTSLPETCMGIDEIVLLGRKRWAIENEGFNEAVNKWHMDHVYRHAPNAMLVLLLLAMLVAGLIEVFYRRDLKPAARARVSLLHVCRMIAAELHSPAPLARGPT
ncbi:MAG: hypothetical protein RL885_00935 [Planctomycetota bacterium]